MTGWIDHRRAELLVRRARPADRDDHGGARHCYARHRDGLAGLGPRNVDHQRRGRVVVAVATGIVGIVVMAAVVMVVIMVMPVAMTMPVVAAASPAVSTAVVPAAAIVVVVVVATTT